MIALDAWPPVVGIDPGSSYVGVCLTVGDTVIEAVTVEADGAGELGVTRLALRAVAVARDLLHDHFATIEAEAARRGTAVPRPLFAIERVVPPRSDTRALKHSALSPKVLSSVISTGVCMGAILSALTEDLTILVNPAGFDHRDGSPACLCGRQPAGWRGRRGSERQHQRSAYWLSQSGLREWRRGGGSALPTLPGDYQ